MRQIVLEPITQNVKKYGSSLSSQVTFLSSTPRSASLTIKEVKICGVNTEGWFAEAHRAAADC